MRCYINTANLKKYSFSYKFALIIVLFLFTFVTSFLSGEQISIKQSLAASHGNKLAQVPSVVCAGSTNSVCNPSSAPSASVTNVPNPSIIIVSPAQVISQTPCTPVNYQGRDSRARRHHHHPKHGGKGSSGGNGAISSFIQQLLNLLIQLLNQIIAMLGGQPLPVSSTPGGTTSSPSGSIIVPTSTIPNPCVPSIAPLPSNTIPSQSVSNPSSSLSPSTAISPVQSIVTVIPSGTIKGRSYPWHTNIVSTTFWVGELFNANLADGSQVCSTYDSSWAYHWSGINNGTVPSSAAGCAGSIIGGCDGVPGANNACATEKRTSANNYYPTNSSVKPKENPFYLDLPFDDVNDSTAFGQRCQVIPWANDAGYTGHCTDNNFSYMKNKFVRIVGPNGNTCYGQVEDAGPSHDTLYHDSAYVFGTNDAQPVQGQFNNAGMDVSPALNGCMGFAELDGQNDKVKWQFVDDVDVPSGPWTQIKTTTPFTP